MVVGQKLIIVSGQGPKDIGADMETQMRQTFERIGVILKEAGASFENVVVLRAYFVRFSRDLPVYRKVRKEYLTEPYPASTQMIVRMRRFVAPSARSTAISFCRAETEL